MIEPKQAVRFVGGKYNGMQGVTTWVGDSWAGVEIRISDAQMTVVEEQRFMQPLAEWRAGRSETELSLKS